jgi:putative addiction module component (TIGR02574 family)
MDRAALLAEILRLPEDERWQLVAEVRDSLPDDDLDFSLTAEQDAELDRRIAEHEKDPSRAIPWEQVLADLRSRIQ